MGAEGTAVGAAGQGRPSPQAQGPEGGIVGERAREVSGDLKALVS